MGTAAKNATTTACGVPIQSRYTTFLAISASFGITSLLVVIQRIWARLSTRTSIGPDDWCIMVTTVVNIVVSVVGVKYNQLGRHIWTLTYSEITHFLIYYYISETSYLLMVALIKLSLLFFYMRIFPSVLVRRLLWGTIIFTALYGILFFLIGLFLCSPVNYFWLSWDKEHHGHCLSQNALSWTNSTIGIAIDLWMISIPLVQIRNLKLDFKRKLGVALMLLLGTL
jgi:hypothetical protein